MLSLYFNPIRHQWQCFRHYGDQKRVILTDDGVPRVHDDIYITQATFVCAESHRGRTIDDMSSIRTNFTIRPKHPVKCCLVLTWISGARSMGAYHRRLSIIYSPYG